MLSEDELLRRIQGTAPGERRDRFGGAPITLLSATASIEYPRGLIGSGKVDGNAGVEGRCYTHEGVVVAQKRQPGRGETDPPPQAGYPSAADIPAFKKLKAELAALNVFVIFKPSLREETKRLKRELDRLIKSVDRFYELIGDRNWIFHGSLKLTDLGPALASGRADEAERAVIDQYVDTENMKFAVMRAKAVPELRAYGQLLDNALRDYQEERYYASVLALLPVLDGFVAAVVENRRGLHSLDEQKLIVWNSLVAHHQGLASTQQSFTRSFNTLNETPLFELHRNGILHGNFSNFDNLIVASKAWNRLFALIDWREARIEAAKPAPVEGTWRETIARHGELEARRKILDAWQPRSSSVAEDGLAAVQGEPVVQSVVKLLEAWRVQNYGQLAQHLYDFDGKLSRGAYIGQVRSRFEGTHLESYALVSAAMRGAGVGHVIVDLLVAGTTERSELRLIHVDETGRVIPEDDPRGRWLSVGNDPFAILGRSWPEAS